MSTFRELTYLVIDHLKLVSDDTSFTERHIMFILSKWRTFLLKQRYADIKKQIPDSNYQTICLNLEDITDIPQAPCGIEGFYKKSKELVPYIMNIGNTRVYENNYLSEDISFISKDRMIYVGYNNYMPKRLYASLGPEAYLYIKGFDSLTNISTFRNVYNVKLRAIFQDAIAASELYCKQYDDEGNIICTPQDDILNREFPIEDGLIPPLLELTVKELTGAVYRPEDNKNNAHDDLSSIPTK